MPTFGIAALTTCTVACITRTLRSRCRLSRTREASAVVVAWRVHANGTEITSCGALIPSELASRTGAATGTGSGVRVEARQTGNAICLEAVGRGAGGALVTARAGTSGKIAGNACSANAPSIQAKPCAALQECLGPGVALIAIHPEHLHAGAGE